MKKYDIMNKMLVAALLSFVSAIESRQTTIQKRVTSTGNDWFVFEV
jgi:hypothetical protein